MLIMFQLFMARYSYSLRARTRVSDCLQFSVFITYQFRPGLAVGVLVFATIFFWYRSFPYSYSSTIHDRNSSHNFICSVHSYRCSDIYLCYRGLIFTKDMVGAAVRQGVCAPATLRRAPLRATASVRALRFIVPGSHIGKWETKKAKLKKKGGSLVE